MPNPWEKYQASSTPESSTPSSSPWEKYGKSIDSTPESVGLTPEQQAAENEKWAMQLEGAKTAAGGPLSARQLTGAVVNAFNIFDIPFKTAAVIEGVKSTVMDDTSKNDRGILERFKEHYNARLESSHAALENLQENSSPILNALSTGVKFYYGGKKLGINPGKFIPKDAGIIGTGLGLGAEVGIIAGVENAIDELSQITTMGKDVRGAAKDLALHTGIEAGTAALTAGTIKGASGPIKNVAGGLLLEPASKLLVGTRRLIKKLNPTQETILKNLENLPKNREEAKAVVNEATQTITKYLKDSSDVIDEGVSKASAETLPLVEDFAMQQKNLFNMAARDVRDQLVKNIPKDIPKTVETARAAVEKFSAQAGKNFGRELDDIAANSGKQNLKIDLKDSSEGFLQGLADAGLGTMENGKIRLVDSQAVGLESFLNNEVNGFTLKPKTLMEAVRFKQRLGAIIDWSREGRSTEAMQRMIKLYDNVDQKIFNELPPALQTRYSTMNNSFKEIIGMSGDLKRVSKNLGRLQAQAETGLNDIGSADVLRDMSTALKTSKELYGTSLKFADENPIGMFSEQEILGMKRLFEDTKKLYNISNASKFSNLEKSLFKLGRQGVSALDDNLDTIKQYVDLYDLQKQMEQTIKQQDLLKPIQDALINPRSKGSVTKALAMIDRYGGEGKTQIKDVLNRAASFQRKTGLSKEVKNLLSGIGEVDPEIEKQILIATRTNPQIEKLLTDARVADAFLKTMPDLRKIFTNPRSAFGELAPLIPVSMGPFGQAATVAIYMFRLMSKPEAFRVFAHRLAEHGIIKISDEQVREIAQHAQRSSRLGYLLSRESKKAMTNQEEAK